VSAATKAKALCSVGVFAFRQGDDGHALAVLDEGLALARGQQPGWVAGLAVHVLGLIALNRGDLGLAEGYVEESVMRARAAGELGLAASFILELGSIAQGRGDLERAAAYYEEGLALAERAGAALPAGDALGDLADMARRRGDVARAELVGREQLRVLRPLSVRSTVAITGLERLAYTAAAADDAVQAERAARLLGAAAVLREQMGDVQRSQRRAQTERAAALAQARLGKDRWAAAFAAGQALSLEEAIAEAVGEAD
jgi:hypothetical protein